MLTHKANFFFIFFYFSVFVLCIQDQLNKQIDVKLSSYHNFIECHTSIETCIPIFFSSNDFQNFFDDTIIFARDEMKFIISCPQLVPVYLQTQES